VSLTGRLNGRHKQGGQNAENGREHESFEVVHYTQENNSYEEGTYAKMNRNREAKGAQAKACHRVRWGTDERKAEYCRNQVNTLFCPTILEDVMDLAGHQYRKVKLPQTTSNSLHIATQA
jgi:hypothetical protein